MYAEAMDEGKASIIKRKDGRPSLNSSHQAEGLTTRPKSEPYIKESCIICHIPHGSASKVEFEATGTLMLQVSKKLQDKRFSRTLNKITKVEDPVTNDVVYHNCGWVNARSKVRPRQQKNDSISHTLSETEVIIFFQIQLKYPYQPYLDMNIVNEIYKVMLLQNGEKHDNLARDYKKQL